MSGERYSSGSGDRFAAERQRWRNARRERPTPLVPGPGQVSVWDFPRPPRLERVEARVTVEAGEIPLADSFQTLRVCETSSPPAYYVPASDVRMELLEPSPRETFCEWKGLACYWSLNADGKLVKDVAWSYPDPDEPYAALRHHLAFHAGRVDRCSVGGARVVPQPGEYYGGWITPDLVGPFKGEPGSEAW